jgi:hypothetical protein
MDSLSEGNVIFRSLGDRSFEATHAASGPWSDSQCHGGAPAALLASAIEATPAAVPMEVARLTVDLMRAVPIGERLHIEVDERHQGKRMQLISARLLKGETVLARASGLKVRTVAAPPMRALLEDPDAAQHQPMPGGFSDQFTIVPVTGGPDQLGPGSRWFRLNGLLTEEKATTQLDRCIAAADFGSGICNELPFEEWLFPSLDLTVSLARPPIGSWVLLQSRWLSASGGRTSCVTGLSDTHGAFGEAIQTVLLEPRPHQ